MKTLAQGVYKSNEKYIPKDWIKVSEFDNSKADSTAKLFIKMEIW